MNILDKIIIKDGAATITNDVDFLFSKIVGCEERENVHCWRLKVMWGLPYLKNNYDFREGVYYALGIFFAFYNKNIYVLDEEEFNEYVIKHRKNILNKKLVCNFHGVSNLKEYQYSVVKSASGTTTKYLAKHGNLGLVIMIDNNGLEHYSFAQIH